MQTRIKIKSVLFGVARLLDIGATFNFIHTQNTDENGDPDAFALSRDWHIVGNDIRHAIKTIESERVT